MALTAPTEKPQQCALSHTNRPAETNMRDDTKPYQFVCLPLADPQPRRGLRHRQYERPSIDIRLIRAVAQESPPCVSQ